MAHATVKRTIALIRASVHGQLLVPAFGAVAIAAALLGVDAVHALLVAQPILLLCIALSARSAVRGVAGYDTTAHDVPGDALQLAPRLLAQTSLVAAPFVGGWWLAMQLAGIVPLAGLVLLALLVPLSLLAPTPLLLAIAAVASGDRRWVPVHAYALASRGRGRVQLHGLVLAGLVVAGLCALPFVLVALVVGSQLGPAAPVAFGLAAVVAVPLLGCGSIACWQVLDADELLRRDAADPGEGVVMPPAPGHAAGGVVGGAGAPAAIEWTDGPTWDVAIDVGAAWGTWIRLPADAQVALRVTWHAGAAPELALATADGAWRHPPAPTAPGVPVAFDVGAGDTYLQLTNRAEVPQAITATLLVPGGAVAA